MRMLAGFMTPTSGTAHIQGHDVQTDGVAARRILGFLPEGAPTYPEMSVEGFLRFCAKVRGFTGNELAERVDHALSLTTLHGVRLQPVETLSKGFKRRVGLAQALLHDPPVLVLDEPTDGLDPNQKHEVRALIATDGARQGDCHLDPLCWRRSARSARAQLSSRTAGSWRTRRPRHWRHSIPPDGWRRFSAP